MALSFISLTVIIANIVPFQFMVMDGGHPLAVTNFHFLVFLIYELHVVAPSPILPNHNIPNAATFTRTAAPPNLWHVHWKRTHWCVLSPTFAVDTGVKMSNCLSKVVFVVLWLLPDAMVLLRRVRCQEETYGMWKYFLFRRLVLPST